MLILNPRNITHVKGVDPDSFIHLEIKVFYTTDRFNTLRFETIEEYGKCLDEIITCLTINKVIILKDVTYL